MYTIIKQKDRKCIWCEKAIQILLDRGLKYDLRELAGEELMSVAKQANMNTVPIIYCNDILIGRYTELEQHVKELN